jgi:CRP/FNR family transcriptional regulator
MSARLPQSRSPAKETRYKALPCATCPGRPLNLCRPLDEALQAAFFGIALRQRWVRRQYLFRSGDPLGPLFKVTSGVVAVSKSLPDGRRQILRIVMPGDVCGYLGEHGRYAFDGEALSDVVTCTFPRAGFDAFVADNSAMAEAVRLELSEVLKSVSAHMTALGQMSSTARVAHFLCDMRALLDARGLSDQALALPLTRSDIADYLGLRLETVSRSFSELRQRELIALDGEGLTILDAPQLAVLAGLRRGA